MTRAHQLLWRFPRAEAAAVAVARCYFVEVQAGAMQAERRVFQEAVAVEIQLADQWEVEAEEAVV